MFNIIYITLLVVLSWAYAGEVSWAYLLCIPFAVYFTGHNLYNFNKHKKFLIPLYLFTGYVLLTGLNPLTAVVNESLLLTDNGLPGTADIQSTLKRLLIIYTIISGAIMCISPISRIYWYWSITIIVCNAVVLLFWGAIAPPRLLPNTSAFSQFIYHNHWGAFCILPSMLLLGLSFRRMARSSNWMYSPALTYLCLIVGFFSSFMVVGSRSVTIMFIVLILLAIACTSNVKRLFPVILVTAIISILSALAFSGNFIQKFTASPDLLTGRLKLYTEVITGISQRKLFGWGLDSFSTIHPLFQEVTMGNYSRAHSDILQVLWDFGLVGVSLLIATVLLFIKLRPKDNFSKYIYISLIGIALLSLVDFPLSNPAVLTSFCLGWVLLYQRLNYRNTLD